MAEQQFTAEELKTEEWRPMRGHEARYAVSSLGRVRFIVTRARRRTGTLLSQSMRGPYLRATILTKSESVHKLVADAFIGSCPLGLQVNHKDGNKTNNRATNLEYVTPAENVRHAIDTLGHRANRGSKHGIAKLTEIQIPTIRRMIACGLFSHREIGRRFGVSASTVDNIKAGKVWSHVRS